MPLIKARASRVRFVRHVSRLKEPNRDALVLYARFIGDTPDYVLDQLIEATLEKDRDFVAWRTEHAAEAVTPNTREASRPSGRHSTDSEG